LWLFPRLSKHTDDDASFSPNGGASVSEQHCASLLKQRFLPATFEFPPECYRFGSVRTGLIRRDSKRDDEAVAFAGMDPGSAIKAMSARERGHPNPAQITRRLTSKSKASESSWF
jgi:hypothetical protein